MSENYLQESSTRRKNFIPLLTLIVLLGAGVGYYYQHANTSVNSSKGDKLKEADAPAAVAVVSATQADFQVYLTGLGTVTALRTVTIKPRVDGELIRIAFTEGQWVKAGDLLAEIDPRPFQIQLEQAEGQLLRDEALLKNAQIDQTRYQTLLEQDSIAAQEVAAKTTEVKQYQGIVAMDKAQVNNAQLQLSYARLTAPIAGQVGLRKIDQGNIVHANDANGIVVITQLQPINVIFTLPEDQVQPVLQRLRSKQTVTLSAFDRTGKKELAIGKLVAIDNQIDAATGTLKLKAQFDNTDHSLFANQFVNIKMLLETLPNAIRIATAAIQNDTEGAFVYVVNAAKTVEHRRITLGPTEGEQVVVLNNLAAGEFVIVEGTDGIHVGSVVDIAEQDGKAIAASPQQNSTNGKGFKRGKRS